MTYWAECARAILRKKRIPAPYFGTETLQDCELQYKAYDIRHQLLRRIGIPDDCTAERSAICERIAELMRENGVFIAHSPESNMNLASGVAPVSRYLEQGLRVGLATDLAGGSSENMLRAMAHAIQASKLRWRLSDQGVKPLSLEQVFWMATAGGGAFFGKVGRFDPGYEFDAVVLDDSQLFHAQPLELRSRLERAVYLADERQLAAKYVAGERLF